MICHHGSYRVLGKLNGKALVMTTKEIAMFPTLQQDNNKCDWNYLALDVAR